MSLNANGSWSFYRGDEFTVLGLLLISAVGCSGQDTEISRVPSPDGLVDAVAREYDAGIGFLGATTSGGIDVYLEAAQGDCREKLLSTTGSSGLDLRWRENQVLEIRYKFARIWSFKNFWLCQSDSPFYMVELRLVPTQPYTAF